MWMCTEQACYMAQIFDKIGNGWRRQWLIHPGELHLEADKVELPECLAALRIDLMGGPAGERPEYMTPPEVPPPLPRPPKVANPPTPTC